MVQQRPALLRGPGACGVYNCKKQKKNNGNTQSCPQCLRPASTGCLDASLILLFRLPLRPPQMEKLTEVASPTSGRVWQVRVAIDIAKAARKLVSLVHQLLEKFGNRKVSETLGVEQ